MEDLLFLCHRIPYPPNKGDKIRSWHILKHLTRRYRVHLGCLYDDPEDMQHIPFLQSICASVYCRPLRPLSAKLRSLSGLLRNEPLTLGYFFDQSLYDWVTDTVRQQRPSRVFVFCSAMATYIRNNRSSLRILDMIALDSEKWRQYANTKPPPMNLLYARERRLLLEFERCIAAEFDATLFVSDAEARRFANVAPAESSNIHVLTNGVDLDYFVPAGAYASPYSGGGPFVVFTGAMDYWPNIQAVTWFANKVLPLVRRRWDNAEFWIVGRDPARSVRDLSRARHIHVTGTVEDIRPYLAQASVVVAPLQTGCGIQNKVLEAMAMAKTVIADPLACEGIKVAARKDILIARTPNDFAAAITAIVSREIASLGSAARTTIEREYRWDFGLLDKLLDEPAAPLAANAG